MTAFLIVLGVIVLAFALRSYAHPVPRKLGAVAILVATYLAAYFLAGRSHVAGGIAVLAWFLLPWIELLTRIRRLRLPVRKSLTHRPPPNSRQFPHLAEFTEEIESAGFDHTDDAGWEWEGLKQFFRIFYHAESRTQAAICLNEQSHLSFAFITITSRSADGRTFRTWNYPFSYTMKLAPEMLMNRVPQAASFAALLGEHRDFLERQGVGPDSLVDEDPEKLPELMEIETSGQIKHNLDRGLIAVAEDPETFRYSWRGLIFLYGQLVKDMVKLS